MKRLTRTLVHSPALGVMAQILPDLPPSSVRS